MNTIYSERHMAHLPLGKLPAREPDKGTLRYADLQPIVWCALRAAKLPTHPAIFGHGNDYSDWLMAGNGPCDDASIPQSWAAYQGAGDCVWAGAAHETMEAADDAGAAGIPFTCRNILEQYGAYSGYNLETGANDNGSDVQQVLAWRQTKGLVDSAGGVHKIGPYVALTVGDLGELWEAAWLFECVGIGVNLQQAQEDQFNSPSPVWDYVAGSQVVGGHYIPVVGLPAPGFGRLVTWAEAIRFTESFYTNCSDEAYVYIDPIRYRAVTGKDAEGMTNAELETYIHELTTAKLANA